MNDAPSIATPSGCSSDPSNTGSFAWFSKSAISTVTGGWDAAGADGRVGHNRHTATPTRPRPSAVAAPMTQPAGADRAAG